MLKPSGVCFWVLDGKYPNRCWWSCRILGRCKPQCNSVMVVLGAILPRSKRSNHAPSEIMTMKYLVAAFVVAMAFAGPASAQETCAVLLRTTQAQRTAAVKDAVKALVAPRRGEYSLSASQRNDVVDCAGNVAEALSVKHIAECSGGDGEAFFIDLDGLVASCIESLDTTPAQAKASFIQSLAELFGL